ncbi:MAG: ABC transporter ATP-binding protein [Litorimonas sp.]
MLEIENLNLRYNNHHALKDLSLQIHAGELIGIIGPNGAGKTSFVKALCGRVKHDGLIKISQKILKHGADRRTHIGLVPQDIGLYPHLTATENLSLIGQLLKVPKKQIRQTVQAALDAVDMNAHEGKRIANMSGGMKRRINVAAAIMHKPSIVIFDEPTAGVDAPARDTVHRLAKSLSQRGMAVLLITHELEHAEALCDKILILNRGTVLDFNTPTNILSRNFKGARIVKVRYATPPDSQTVAAMKAFEFSQGEHSTIWTAMTQASEVSFVSAFMSALHGANETIREISVSRPGLTALMHKIENVNKS